jgi:phosphoadenosine phosphosulfate reductase
MKRGISVPYDLVKLNAEFEKSTAIALLQWALKSFSPKITLASSFGAEDVVLIDILMKLDPKIKVFTLDTGRLNEETYEVMDKIRKKYGIVIESYFPDKEAVQKIERDKGFYSFRESVDNRKECCAIRKVEPLGRALKGLEAWITGLRRDQGVTRADVHKIEADAAHPGLFKVNPLADWSHQDVWNYIKKNSVPYNRLHDQGYPSIGCAPCTRAVKPGEDIRAGRWWWESADHKECGIHQRPKK